MNIVIVDDNAVNLMLMAALARSATGHEPVRFDDPVRGLAWCRENGADLIIVDFMMPVMDGHQFIEGVRATPLLAEVPVVMVTAAGQSVVRRRALEIGATDFLTKPVDSTEIKLRLRNLLQLRSVQNLLRDRAAHLSEEVKVATPDHILLKRAELSSDETVEMHRHAEIGGRILSEVDSPLLRLACEIAETHHERYDGSGYPRGLEGDAIPLGGRIVAVADVFDALNSTRPYKHAWSLGDSRAYLEQHSGQHFDPRCVSAFVSGWDEVLAIRARFPD